MTDDEKAITSDPRLKTLLILNFIFQLKIETWQKKK